jgi:hypothetical protein
VTALDISVRLIAPGLDADEIHEATRSLREEILGADVDDMWPGTAGPLPEGAKSAETIALGALVVALAPSVVQSLMGVLSSWLSRQSAEMELEIDGARIKGPLTNEERELLVAAYLRRIEDRS